MNLGGKSKEEVIAAIKEKKNTDFCGVYELFYHDKLKKNCMKKNKSQLKLCEQSENSTQKHDHFKTLKYHYIEATEEKHPLINPASAHLYA
jgi:hypothetical protein